MGKYIVASIKAGNKGLSLQVPVSSFEGVTGVEVFDEDGEVGMFAEDDIKEYTLEHFDDSRYDMGIEEDEEIIFTGFEIKDEDDEELM